MHFSEPEDFTSKHFHPSDPLSDLHLEATTLLLKVSLVHPFVFHIQLVYCFTSFEINLFEHVLQVLKAHDNVITSPQLVEEIEKVNAAILDYNSKLQNGEAKDSSASNAYGDDVEAEANAYFHQMFSGQLSVDAMVQMLSRYKDSLVQRFDNGKPDLFVNFNFSYHVYQPPQALCKSRGFVFFF